MAKPDKIVYVSNNMSMIDNDKDNSYEFDVDVYNDPTVVEAINYLVSMVFYSVEIEDVTPEKLQEYYKHKEQYQIFLIQYIVDGYSANIEGITLKNNRIEKKLKNNSKWHIKYKNLVFESFSDEGKDEIIIISDKKFCKDEEYDKFISNDYLVFYKNFLSRKDKLVELINKKNDLLNILNTAVEKSIIPTLVGYISSDIEEDDKIKIQRFLESYKNGSAMVVNEDLIKNLTPIENKPDVELLFRTLTKIDVDISSLLGFTNSIMVSERTYAYSTVGAMQGIINRNVDAYKEIMESVINDICEKNKYSYRVKIKKITEGENDVPTN